jgi:CBS domain-containing protein
MTWFVGLMAAIYLIGRTGGKMLGATLGARLSNAPRVIQKYLPLCLFSQAGVAIGLSILVGQRFPGPIGDAIVVIITATTFVVQIIGPTFVKSAITRAGEVGLNITEEDLIRQTHARDIMQKDTPLIYENMPLNKILKIFSSHANIFYPVVDVSKKLVGIMTIDTIKNTFMTRGLDDFLLAHDLMEPVIAEATPDTSMSEVKEMLDNYHMEYLPVVDKTKKVVGFLESRAIKRLISQKIVAIQKHSESLEQDEKTDE